MIQIKNPCDANWKEMSSASSGKYCGACEKVVVDFSKMNDVQIKEYFTEYTEQKTCGRFLTSQVDRPLIIQTNKLKTRIWRNNNFTLLRSLLLLCASSVMWISSCVKKHTVPGKVENNTCEPILMGDTISTPIEPDTSAHIQEDTIRIIQGEITEHVPVKMGKIRMVDTISQKIKRK